MIKLKYSSSLDYYNNSAVFSDEYVSSSLGSVIIDLTSSISTYRGTITGSIFSNKTGYTGGWLLIASSGSNAPTASGHYDANIYEAKLPEPLIYTGSWAATTSSWVEALFEWDGNIGNEYWSNTTTIWNETQETWAGIKAQILTRAELIAQERVFVTGSDYNEEYKYENQELAYYNVYDG